MNGERQPNVLGSSAKRCNLCPCSRSAGPRGWIQRAGFVGTGLLMLAFADGLRQTSRATPSGSRWGPRLVAAYAVGLIGAGIFVTEPGADTAAEGPDARPAGLEGALHVAFSMQVFVALSAAALVYARWFSMHGRHTLARGSALVGALIPAGIVVFGRAQGRADRLGRAAGPIQRLTIALGWGWVLVFAADGLSNRSGDSRLRR